jgi:hypothetical protein
VIGVGASGDVPGAFVDGDHFSGVAGDAAVREEVGRVGDDEVDGGWRDLGENVEAVALVDAEVVFGVVENQAHRGLRVNGGGEIGHRNRLTRRRAQPRLAVPHC